MSTVTYEDTNQMVKALAHEFEDSWVNQESLKFLRRGKYAKTQVNIKHVPEEWSSKSFRCQNGHDFYPDWLAKIPPVSCFKLKSGMFRQATVNTACTVCEAGFDMEIYQPRIRGESAIFGDEAFREVDGKTVLCYSFVGFSGGPKKRRTFKKEFDKAKKYLAPTINPDDWVLHVKDLVGTERRRGIEHLAHLNRDQVIKGLKQVLAVIAKYSASQSLNVYSAISVVKQTRLAGATKLQAQSFAYSAALMRVVSEYTRAGVMPAFYFERTGSDGWAKDLFDGGRLTLLWARLTNGVPVKSPEFVLPTNNFLLEVADSISYVVARELYAVGSRASGKPLNAEFDTKLLGRTRYIWTDAEGGWNNFFGNGFPMAAMFKGTDWERFI